MITIITIGKSHDPQLVGAIEDYSKRLTKPFNPTWDIIKPSGSTGTEARLIESEAILKRLRPDHFVIVLDETGTSVTSLQHAELVRGQLGSKDIVYVIGGAYGVSPELLNRADAVIAFGKSVFPHQLVRLMLTEQIYRIYSINSGGKYHHE